MPEEQNRLTDIFNSALEREPSERGEFVREACGQDEKLRAEVESLLGRYDSAFLEKAAGSEFVRDPISSETMIGRQLGAYRIVQEIGHGGMAVVFLAERADQEYRKRVAIKMVKLGVDSKETLSRFRNERQTLAALDHPNIVKLLDGGSTEEGWPYLVMEYVEGTPIDEYCDAHRLSVPERLELFRAVCSAVQHAHQNLVIHRDLKPGNILVTRDGVPRLLDFGIAKLLNPEYFQAPLVTKGDWRPMTPEYASPEQVRGETITTASDLYSLGVLLYHLLCGRRPYRRTATSWVDVGRQVCEEDPEKPSTAVFRSQQLSGGAAYADAAVSPESVSQARRTKPDELRRRLRGDLDTIVLKALRKEPQQRYSSAEQFSADIARHLRHEPVIAATASTGYRVRKYVRRHRAGVAATASVLLLLVAFAAAQAVQLRRITRERDRANRISDFMTDMFKVSDPSQARGNSVTAREILDKAAQNIDKGLARDADLQAQMMEVMGVVYGRLGLLRPAESLLRRSFETRRRTQGPEHPDTLRTARFLAWNLEREGQDAEAEKLQRQTVESDRRVLGAGHVETLRAANDLTWTIQQEGRYAEAEKLARETLETERRVLGSENQETMKAMGNLGWILNREGHYAEAEKLQRENLEVRRRILGADEPDTLSAINNLGVTLRHENRLSEAEQLYREMLEIARRVLGPEHPLTLRAMNNLGNVLTDERDYAEAEKLCREILEVRQRTLGRKHPETLSSLANLANALAAEAKYVEAYKLTREALEARLRILGPDHPDTADSEYNLATIDVATGKRAEAFQMLTDAVDHGFSAADDLALASDPEFKMLHVDPRFEVLIAHARQRAAALQEQK
ncbi:MAG TPA: serine/threonine-protein kinase [Candidatus Acidoferrum sp.]|nr:serine/threonine-protein kinase [Candidatus Acidoferrum sp.]